MKKLITIGLATIGLVGLIIWAYLASSQPLPGIAELQPGRDHHPEGTKLTYNFNPPTSGDHYPSWITKGFYDTPRADGNLVHSMEHGYVVFWYDCSAKITGMAPGSGSFSLFALVPSERAALTTSKDLNPFAPSLVLAQTTNQTTSTQDPSINMTTGGEGSPSASLEDLPEQFRDGSCDQFKSQLKDLLNKYGPHKLIAAPRPGMGHPLILTAWGRVLTLDKLDQTQIKQFIDTFRDHGPELTDEP